MQKIINQIEPGFTKKELNEVKKYLNSGGWITEHTQTKLFEENLAKFTGRKYCVTFPNGTITMSAALYCLGIRRNDEVIVVANNYNSSTLKNINNIFINKNCVEFFKGKLLS